MSPGSNPAHGQRHSLERKVMLPAARDRAAEAKGRLESQWDIPPTTKGLEWDPPWGFRYEGLEWYTYHSRPWSA